MDAEENQKDPQSKIVVEGLAAGLMKCNNA
jgi:hypothetical protein